MAGSNVVIIGGGPAAAQVAIGLRGEGYRGRVVLFGGEPGLPYRRSRLTKGYLSDTLSQQDLQVRDAFFYRQADIELHLGTVVSRLSLVDRTVHTRCGLSVGYDHLAIATGSRPRLPGVLDVGHPGVRRLHTEADALALRPLLRRGKRLVVLGGDFVALELAAVARAMGLDVDVLVPVPGPEIPPTAGLLMDFCRQLHADHGVRIRLGATVRALDGSAVQPSVLLEDGTRMHADVLVSALGTESETRVALDAGLVCNRGILVDAQCRTSVPGIYAAGDCTERQVPGGASRNGMASEARAIAQGQKVAAMILGKEAARDELSAFWSDQYGVRFQFAGDHCPHDDVIVRGQPARHSFAVYSLRGDRVAGVAAVNRPMEYALACSWITQGSRICPDRLADDARPARRVMEQT